MLGDEDEIPHRYGGGPRRVHRPVAVAQPLPAVDLPPPPSSLRQDSSINLPSPSIFSSPEQILSCRVNKRFLVFSLEFLGGSFNMYLVNLEEKNFFWLIISFSL